MCPDRDLVAVVSSVGLSEFVTVVVVDNESSHDVDADAEVEYVIEKDQLLVASLVLEGVPSVTLCSFVKLSEVDLVSVRAAEILRDSLTVFVGSVRDCERDMVTEGEALRLDVSSTVGEVLRESECGVGVSFAVDVGDVVGLSDCDVDSDVETC